MDCGLNSHRYEGRRQRLLVMCLHIKKLKEIFTGVASLENFNNKIVLKSVIFFSVIVIYLIAISLLQFAEHLEQVCKFPLTLQMLEFFFVE